MGVTTIERGTGTALWPAIAERLRREIAERYEPDDFLPAEAALAAGLDPAKDLAAIRMTGSHAKSLKALAEGRVDAASAG